MNMQRKKHEGDVLREWISSNRTSARQLALKIGVTTGSVTHQYKLQYLSGSFVEKLDKAGINIFTGQDYKAEIEDVSIVAEPSRISDSYEALKYVIESQKSIINEQKALIESQKQFIASIYNNNKK